jgi:hypothetical protein
MESGPEADTMDLTPEMLAGAALGARVRPPIVAIAAAVAGYLVLDALPHLDVVWINGHLVPRIMDICLGAALVAAVCARLRNPWVFAGAFFAVLPDAPPLKPWEEQFPHGILAPPWGTAVEAAVAGLALLAAVTALPRRPARGPAPYATGRSGRAAAACRAGGRETVSPL